MQASPKEEVRPQKKTIALIQLTRLGDIIQTSQVAKFFKESYPDYRIVLVARKSFATPLRFLIDSCFDECFLFESEDILRPSLGESKNALQEFLNKTNSLCIDVLINLSFSKTSTHLSSLINSVHKLGPFTNPSGSTQINDKWSQFVFSNVMGGPHTPFSLIDIFRSIIGIEFEKINTKPLLPSLEKVETLILHPFASHTKKRWPEAKWVEVLLKVLKTNPKLKVKVVGGRGDIQSSKKITNAPLLSKYAPRIENITGKVEIKNLSEHFTKNSLFVGHDSMVGHLAALNNVQTLTIALGTVRPYETTPYQSDGYVLAPKTKCFPCFPSDDCPYMQCHADIPYQLVASCIDQLLDSRKIEFHLLEEKNSKFFLNATSILKTSFSSQNFLTLSQIGEEDLSIVNIVRTFYRIAWQYYFQEIEERYEYPLLSKSAHEELLALMRGMQHLYELAEFGKKYSRYILEEVSKKTPDIGKIKSHSIKIDEIDSLLGTLKATSPLLSPIIDFTNVAKANLSGNNLVELTESSFYTFNDCSILTSIIFDLSEKSIATQTNKQSIHSAANA